MASNTIKEAMGLVNKRSVTDHVDGRRMREFNRTWRKEKFIVCTYVLVGTDLTTKLIANKPCFSSKVIGELANTCKHYQILIHIHAPDMQDVQGFFTMTLE